MSVVSTSLRNRIQMWSEKFFKHGNNPTYACLTACQTDTSSHPHQKIQHKKKSFISYSHTTKRRQTPTPRIIVKHAQSFKYHSQTAWRLCLAMHFFPLLFLFFTDIIACLFFLCK